ncbi:putative ABC transport system ATP-binding protein [Trichococcus flocculiformis]|uniref:ABC transporter ATP-binding protein n=1 Tax=Carnobacteriaceae TaxID=186828 RepID=UPI0007A8F19F|nr:MULTISPECIES: ABC transporter ATP-binding protein [Carnobacteriaceae]MDE1548769.1 ABC transporter ATP-binding protein [Jeotgalibaca caeni]CZR08914.1 abc transporter [Trichococcus sp. ES5]SHG08969.1 putative ABC transport system ATP-binding protein [Trichococcus flocculiformis]
MKLIELQGVTKSFNDGNKEVEALKKTDFSVESGEFVAIIGPSGSGKSTFLTIIGGLQTPTEGRVLIREQKFSEVDQKERNKMRFEEIGFILQASNLVPFLKVEDQMRLVNKVERSKFDKEKAEDLFEGLGITKLRNKYPSDLSGGERQRVAIARALYHDPSVILADEPTASLDTTKAFEVVEILARETKEKNKATIMVTHDERLIDYCDKVYVMKDGVLSLKED